MTDTEIGEIRASYRTAAMLPKLVTEHGAARKNERRDGMGNNTCPLCGARLDPGERCDCEKWQEKAPNGADTPNEATK